MIRKTQKIVGRVPKAPVAEDSDRVPEKDIEALAKEIEELTTTGPIDGASESRQYRQDSIAEDHVLAWYIKEQIQSSHLTPTEIAERAGVSISQI